MFRPTPPVLKLCSWSCIGLMNLFGGGNERPKTDRYIRPFSISSVQHVKLPSDARLIQDQNLSHTNKGKNKINTDKVPLAKLKAYIEKNLDADLVQRTAINRDNTQTTKIIQNLYVTSLGGLKLKTLKNYKVNLLLNASIDLPIVELGGAESIRVPISEKEPDSLSTYINDVADKIHENYLKNGQTVIYCHDGNRNSIALSAGYLVKYTDLFLSEALTHLQYTRKGFELTNGNLGGFKKPLEKFAKKLKKLDSCDNDEKSASISAKNSGKPASTKKTKGKSQKSQKAN